MKNILIVGGSRGIGAATSELLQAKQHHVQVADIYKPISQVDFTTLDISSPNGYANALAQFKSQQKQFDALIITAAMHSAFPSEYATDQLIDHVMAVNLTGHIKFVRDMIPLMNKESRIIAVSSIAAGVGIPMEALYSASKAGLEIFYESLSVEIAYRNIYCSIIQPGNVNTGFNETNNDFKGTGQSSVDVPYQTILKRIDSRLGMSPVDVARVIVHAVEAPRPKFSYIVGQNALKAHWAKRLLGRDLALTVMKKFFGI